ncbi:putative capsid protein [Tentweb spider associated circular virus 1]|uniref:Putative capsid protein n=1 Tax=Tentweb spider associated circular virus 1 TaxID=2293307 RepID=A0A346BPD1_9VIRU|nr:putative capsid protein [Tentweb spider associated circular virus 1]AXL65928.1 putative capsid protein [Tentweb spider associated circular virus 1]
MDENVRRILHDIIQQREDGYRSGMSAAIRGIDQSWSIPATGPFTTKIRFSLGDLMKSSATQYSEEYWQLEGYYTIFDQVKVVKVMFEYWLTDDDVETTPNAAFVRQVYSYDPDSADGNMTWDNVIRVPDHAHRILKPGVIYRTSLKPKFAVQLATPNGTFKGYSKNMWIDCGDVAGYDQAKSVLGSVNAIHMAFKGPEELGAIGYRRTLFLKFRKRRQGAVVN